MVYATMCVGKEWNREFKKSIKNFAENNILYILTDSPESYQNNLTVKYERKVFSYFEKIRFIFDIIKINSKRVTYIDANKIKKYNANILFNDEKIYTGRLFSLEHLYKYYFTSTTLSDIGLIFEKIGVKDLKHYLSSLADKKYPREHILSVPYLINIEEIINDLKIIQPYLESYYNSVPRTPSLKRYSEVGVGYAEGWALVAIAIKYGLEIKSLNWEKKSLI